MAELDEPPLNLAWSCIRDMATLTIRLPDDKHERLRQLAERRSVSMNKLIEELSTVALVEFDAETRFRARAAMESREQGFRLLDELDRSE